MRCFDDADDVSGAAGRAFLAPNSCAYRRSGVKSEQLIVVNGYAVLPRVAMVAGRQTFPARSGRS